MGVNVLSMLTRLRQIALDRNLIPANYLEASPYVSIIDGL